MSIMCDLRPKIDSSEAMELIKKADSNNKVAIATTNACGVPEIYIAEALPLLSSNTDGVSIFGIGGWKVWRLRDHFCLRKFDSENRSFRTGEILNVVSEKFFADKKNFTYQNDDCGTCVQADVIKYLWKDFPVTIWTHLPDWKKGLNLPLANPQSEHEETARRYDILLDPDYSHLYQQGLSPTILEIWAVQARRRAADEGFAD